MPEKITAVGGYAAQRKPVEITLTQDVCQLNFCNFRYFYYSTENLVLWARSEIIRRQTIVEYHGILE